MIVMILSISIFAALLTSIIVSFSAATDFIDERFDAARKKSYVAGMFMGALIMLTVVLITSFI